MAANWQRGYMRLLGAREQAITVTEVEDILPWYRRITFSGPAFINSIELYPSAWVRLWVPSLDDPSTLRQRGYTLVNPDKASGTFALDFVLHEPVGAASNWAKNARLGETVEIATSLAKLKLDTALENYLLLGDATAIPAINSLIDALPETAQITVIIQDEHPDAAALPIRKTPNASLTIVKTSGELIDSLLAKTPDHASSYVWAAGERKVVARIREIVRKQWQLPKAQQHTQYYWIEGKPFG